MKHHLWYAGLAAAAFLAAVGAHSRGQPGKTVATDAPAGAYRIDPTHADLSFRLSHLGFSMYTARFTKVDAQLQFDPKLPERNAVTATIDTTSLALPSPPADFAQALLGPDWLDAGKYPTITYRSRQVRRTGADTADVTGDLTLHGVTRPVVLHASFNGGYAGNAMDPNGRLGFSAKGSFKRSDFGIAYGIPAPGTTMGVGDAVEVTIEAEFTGPPKK